MLLYVLKHEYSYVDVLKVMLIGQPIEMMVSSSKHCSAMWAFLQKGIGCQGQPICEVNIDVVFCQLLPLLLTLLVEEENGVKDYLIVGTGEATDVS